MEVNLTINPPKRFVVKISGHILNPDNVGLVIRYGKLLREFWEKGLALSVVVGGGVYARKYIGAVREIGVSEAFCDMLGIHVTRANALLLISAIGYDATFPEPPRSLGEFLKAYSSGKVVVCGGFEPGQSTAAVAALIAEAINADILALAARVDAVYDKDPKLYPDAKKLDVVSIGKLKEILEKQSVKAGRYELLDPLAIKIIERSKTSVVVFNGRKVEYLEKLVYEGKIFGTLITK